MSGFDFAKMVMDAQAASLQFEPLREGIREEIRKADAQIERDLPAIRNHEDCLFRAIQDMTASRKAMSDERALWEAAPGAKGAFRSVEATNFTWAQASALKHMKALREEFPYYKLPDYLREAYNNAVGA